MIRKHLRAIFLSLVFVGFSIGLQASEADSLLKQLPFMDDSVKLVTLIRLADMELRNYPEKSEGYLNRAVELAEARKDSLQLSRAYSFFGVLHKNKGAFATALEYHFKSETINQKMNLRRGLASNYNDIGIIYKTMGEFENALEYYRKSNAICTEMGLTRGIIMTLNNMGTIYEALGKYDEAIVYYNRAYDKAVTEEVYGGQANTLNNLGEIYANQGDTPKALDAFKRALEIDKITGDNFGHIYSLANIASCFIGLKQFDSAKYYYDNAMELAESLGSTQQIISLYGGLTRYYTEQGDYKSAFEQLQLFKTFQDSVYNETRSLQLAEAEKRFEADKKDREIVLLKQEQLIKNLEIEQHRAERTALLIGIVLAAFILMYLYNRHRQKQKAILNRQLLLQKERHMKAIVDTQEQERKRIAKDLHDGVGQSLSGIKLKMDSFVRYEDTLPKTESDKLKELVSHIDEACAEVRSISHQMMPKVLQDDGLVPAISDMLDKSFRNSPIKCEFEHHGLTGRLSENIEVGIYRICQELINNIIKHAGASKVNVQLFKNASMLILLVEDNGKGFAYNKKKNEGIGLMNINSRVETINGEFNLQPSPSSGTLATIKIPA